MAQRLLVVWLLSSGCSAGAIELGPGVSRDAGSNEDAGSKDAGNVDADVLDADVLDADAVDPTFTSVSAGGAHTCALSADGSADCWGYNAYGQATPPSDVAFVSLSAGREH